MNKFYRLLSLAVLLSLATTTHAHDFEVDGIYYNITSETNLEVAVTFRGDKSYSYYDEYSGAVIIPESATYESKTYSVTSIEGYTFYACSGLTSVTIPNSVKSIGKYAFMACHGLTSVTIPEGVTSIGNHAFYGCDGLTSITIPEGVTSIGNYAFLNCSSLTSVSIAEGITSIGEGFCSGCSGLTSIIIPKGVTSIGGGAFYGCSSLTSVIIPEGVTSIEYFAFEGCSSLTSVTIPNSVNLLGNEAFAWCDELTSITIPSSVTSIGAGAFSGCSGLTSIEVEAGNKVYDSREESNAIIETASNSIVAGCQNTTIPNSVTTIGFAAFYECINMTSISIPSSITSIEEKAFSGCIGLTSVTIPSSVTSIGNSAFSDCTSISTLICDAVEPPVCDSSAFGGVDRSTCTLFVPEESLSLYENTAPWSEFLNINSIPTGIKDVKTDGLKVQDIQVVYDLNGRRLNDLQSGLNIIRMSDGTVKKMWMK